MVETLNPDRATLAWTLPWDADWVTAVTFLGPTRRLAAGNNLGQILLWDLPGKAGGQAPPPVRRLDGHTNAITHLRSTPDGRQLISASYDHTIRYWDVEAPPTGSATVPLNARTREDLVRRRASKVPAPLEAKVQVQPAQRTLEGHKEWVQGLVLSADGKLLVSGDDGGVVIVWDRAAGKEMRRWRVKGWVYALGLAPDNKRLVVSERVPLVFDASRHAGVKLWDLTTGQLQRDLGPAFGKEYTASTAAFAPDGRTLAVGRGGEVDGPSGKITFVDPESGAKRFESSTGHIYGATDLVFHPDGKHLLSSGRDTLVRVWQVADGKQVKELGKQRGGQFKDWIHALALSPDGRWLAAADMAGQVEVWSLG
jgi:WD40 repeat protein